MSSFLYNQLSPGGTPSWLYDNTETHNWIVDAVLDNPDFKGRVQKATGGGSTRPGDPTIGGYNALRYCMPSYNGGSPNNWEINGETANLVSQINQLRQEMQKKINEYTTLTVRLQTALDKIYTECGKSAPCSLYCLRGGSEQYKEHGALLPHSV